MLGGTVDDVGVGETKDFGVGGVMSAQQMGDIWFYYVLPLTMAWMDFVCIGVLIYLSLTENKWFFVFLPPFVAIEMLSGLK